MTPEIVTADELFRIPLFEDEDPAAVRWIAGLMTVVRLDAGQVLVNPGDPVTDFEIVLEGEIHFVREADPSAIVMIAPQGTPIGVLPFSRLKTSLGRGWAVRPTRLAVMDASHHREVVYRAPLLAQRLVAHMTDRTREVVHAAENSSRLLALGKLAAGLAHELNNPAAAAVRSSARLREINTARRRYAIALRAQALSPQALDAWSRLSEGIEECSAGFADELERADRESDLADWLDGHEIPGELASGLLDAGLTPGKITPLIPLLSAPALTLALRMLSADHEVLCLTRELEEASRRVSDLVQSVKSYSWMDQSAVSEVDIAQGIDSTLRIFQHQIKHGVHVSRRYAPETPKIRANGSSLNQIWTNLIDNSLDALETMPSGEPRVLTVSTTLEPNAILVEIGDNGPGIPPDVQRRIFEPFFTTKAVGEGTGLGLDIVQRIVRSHLGSIRVESEPGRTVFQVRLPTGTHESS